MKISFVIPTPRFVESAGARIRYLRLIPLMEDMGHEMTLIPIADFDTIADPGDVVIFSKCFDARALIAATECKARGRMVGVDLFDDYFSQVEDSRMVRFRTWFAQVVNLIDFACCSTPRMAELVTMMKPGIPVHVFNDPSLDLNIDHLSSILDRKYESAMTERRIRLCWFGIGDNPFFNVGLNDLTAYASSLEAMLDEGWELDLTISTNLRALDANRLAAIQKLPFPVSIEIWSEEAEAELLQRSFCCFLPVNAQAFSIAKSLNRAVSALSAGCQVLSAGYPLYDRLEDIIYDNPAELLRDLKNNSMRLSGEHIGAYEAVMTLNASLEHEAGAFRDMLQGLLAEKTPATSDAMPVLVHGRQTLGEGHTMSRNRGWLTVASPFSPPDLLYDIVFTGSLAGGDLRMIVSDTILSRLPASQRRTARPFGKLHRKAFFALDWPEGQPLELYNWHAKPIADQLIAYRGMFAAMKGRLEDCFGPVRMVVSENSRMPFDPDIGASGEPQ